MELRRSEMDALRLYIHLGSRLHVSPAEGLADKVRAARQLGNRWVLYLNDEQVESVAYAFHLRAMAGSTAEANRFGREYGVVFSTGRTTGIACTDRPD